MKYKYDDDNEPESYRNEEGLTVFTPEFLLKRGYCCGYGCRHCPYQYEAVREPRRSILLRQRNDNESQKKQEGG